MSHLLPMCPFLDPVVARIGPVAVNWYGIMYTLGVAAWYFVTWSEIGRKGGPIPRAQLPELLFDGLIGGVIGARIGYVLLYNLPQCLEKPWEIFAFWQGGMSAHGWLVGMAVTGLAFVHEHRVPIRELVDTVYLGLPLGIAAIKLGNFINCEGFGHPTNLPWGVVVPSLGLEPRHPSQLYEAFLEGILLFVALWTLRGRLKRPGDLSCIFLVAYGCLRFFIEFTREAEPSLTAGFWSPFTTGQWLSIVVVCLGLAAYVITRRGCWDGNKA